MKVLLVAERFAPARGGMAAAAARQAAALAPYVERLDVLVPVAGPAPGQVSIEDGGRLRVFRVQRAPEADESLQLLSRTAQNLVSCDRYALVHGVGAVHALRPHPGVLGADGLAADAAGAGSRTVAGVREQEAAAIGAAERPAHRSRLAK